MSPMERPEKLVEPVGEERSRPSSVSFWKVGRRSDSGWSPSWSIYATFKRSPPRKAQGEQGFMPTTMTIDGVPAEVEYDPDQDHFYGWAELGPGPIFDGRPQKRPFQVRDPGSCGPQPTSRAQLGQLR